MVDKDFITKIMELLDGAEKVLEKGHEEAENGKNSFPRSDGQHRAAWHMASTSSFLALTSVKMTKLILEGIAEADK